MVGGGRHKIGDENVYKKREEEEEGLQDEVVEGKR